MFNPDQYLSEKGVGGGFDPDAYLAEKESPHAELERFKQENQAKWDAVQLPPVDPKTGEISAEEQAKFTSEQAMKYDAGGWDARATSPVGQRMIDNANTVAAGAGVSQLAALAGKGAMVGAKAVANSKPVNTVRDTVAKWLENKSLDVGWQAIGGTKGAGNAAKGGIGEEASNALAKMARDEGIIQPYASAKTMQANMKPMQDASGAKIGALRQEGNVSGAAPELDDILAQADAQYGRKFSKGLEAGSKREFMRAKEELTELAPKTTTDFANAATDMNAFARSEGKMLRPNNATTKVADLVSGSNDANLVQSLGPEKGLEYVKELPRFGQFEDMGQLLEGLRSGQKVGSDNLPMSRLGMVSNAFEKVAPATARTHWYQKLSQKLQTEPQAFGRNSETLMRAMKNGKASLNSTIYMLQQQDPEFKTQFEEMNK